MSDPIETILDEHEGEYLDDYVIQLCTWSDVVKNDLRKVSKLNDSYLNKTLHKLITSARDRNGRYRFNPTDDKAGQRNANSSDYIRVQTLISEWLCIYRALHVYLDGKVERDDIFTTDQDLENFEFKVK